MNDYGLKSTNLTRRCKPGAVLHVGDRRLTIVERSGRNVRVLRDDDTEHTVTREHHVTLGGGRVFAWIDGSGRLMVRVCSFVGTNVELVEG